MQYCEPNISVFDVWKDRGISHCFLDTAFSAFLLLWMLVITVVELTQFRRHATLVDNRLKPNSYCYKLQLLLHVLLSVVFPLVWLLAYWRWFSSLLYWHHVVRGVTQMALWSTALLVTVMERRYQLPTPPTAGHGIGLLLFWTGNLVERCLAVVSFNSHWWWWHLHDKLDQIKLIIFAIEFVVVASVFVLGLRAPGLPSLEQRYQFTYGRLPDPETGSNSGESSSTWKNLWKKLKKIMPYIWPKKSRSLQFRVFLCFLILVVGRVLNVYLPLYYKWIVNSLTYPKSGSDVLAWRWDLILVYSALRFLQGGFLNAIRNFLWITVEQYTERELEVKLYEHLHNLSLRWHIGRKTGEVLRVMDRGTNSINSLLNYILFNIVPTIADIIIAITFFVSMFNAWFGLIVFITIGLYLVSTIIVTEWRTKYRRQMNLLSNATRAKGVDSLLNFETVKYYGAEEYEVNRYRAAMVECQAAEWLSTASLSLLNTVQSIIIGGGLLFGTLLCSYLVANRMDGLTVGDYVLFTTYVMQLYGPLNFIGTIYRVIQQAFIDMENMFDLLEEKEEVKDLCGAPEYDNRGGQIEFRNVSFGYSHEKPVLNDISFNVPRGKTLALVGPSGGGKSTIVRLLFRFYDVGSGAILIDGQDIREVTQRSLRKHIGVVPQDTVLFNDTIRYNIRYGDFESDDSQVEDAARAAEIHDKILTFPDQYESVVGERGLKLSGGEKQRVAIARTILKAPSIVLLDEATSALDTKTERSIQSALTKICAGRTTVVVAHRLSTIIGADEIIVLQHGKIAERGSHAVLLEAKGVYYDMWNQQLTHEKTDAADTEQPDQVSDQNQSPHISV